jgi:ParB-like chromosome segregation protein Spo0J
MPDQDSLQILQDEMRDIRATMGKMADALTKLSVLEERNLIANTAIEKMMARQDKADERLQAVILDHAKFEANIAGISTAMKWMWAAFGSGVIYIGGQVIKHYAN